MNNTFYFETVLHYEFVQLRPFRGTDFFVQLTAVNFQGKVAFFVLTDRVVNYTKNGQTIQKYEYELK